MRCSSPITAIRLGRGTRVPLAVAAWAVVTVLQAGVAAANPSDAGALRRAFARESITILVTDSGLGGLAVAAEIERELRSLGAFRQVSVVFASALPDVTRTYNAMANRRDQVRTFDLALAGMTRWYKPDLILVACNTLSVLLPDTPFARSGRVPVVGIVDAGVRALVERLRRDPSAVALVLGTATTIASGAHRQGLNAAGIGRDRVQEQACPGLETEIQNDPGSDLVRGLIEAYGDEARRGLVGRAPGRVVVGLCCSHYGYVRAVFAEVLGRELGPGGEVVDPNHELVSALLAHARRHAFPSTGTDVRVVSRAALSEQERASIGAALAPVSPKAAAALQSYERKSDLFEDR